MRETFSEEGFGEGGKAGTVPTWEQMAGTAEEEGLRSFCFVVGRGWLCPRVSQAAGVQVHRQLLLLPRGTPG